jgi:hypothetical protein
LHASKSNLAWGSRLSGSSTACWATLALEKKISTLYYA